MLITDLSEKRLEIARELGFLTCRADTDVIAYASELFGSVRGRLNCPVFIDAAGVGANIDLFLNNAPMGAKLGIVAVHHRKYEIDLMKVTYGQYHIIGSPAYDTDDVTKVMDMLREGSVPVEKLITHRYPIDQLKEALEMAGNAEESLKVIIDYR